MDFVKYRLTNMNNSGAVVIGVAPNGMELLIRESRIDWITIVCDYMNISYWDTSAVRDAIKRIRERGEI